jgi:glutathione S-transferase
MEIKSHWHIHCSCINPWFAWRDDNIMAHALCAYAQAFHREIDEVLAGRPYVCGDKFTIADISLLCSIDFGAGPVRV